MPQTELFFYQEEDGTVPVHAWLRDLAATNRKAAAACIAKLKMLHAFGHELRRPSVDLLRDCIYELRAKQGRVNYRMLYFFHGKNVAVLAAGLTKEKKVPPADIKRALQRKKRYEQDPDKHRTTIAVPQNPEDL